MSLAASRPTAAPTEAACCLNREARGSGATSCAQPAIQRGFRPRKVTFLIMLPSGGTSVASVLLEDLPLLTAAEAQRASFVNGGGASAVERLASSTLIQTSRCGLYVPGHFLLSFAAARAGIHTADAASKLRLVVQQKEVYPHTCLPVETILGTEAGAALASDWGIATPAAIESKPTETSPGSPLCSLWLLLRLPGGKGGFGALLKKQRRKKRANFSIDACRWVQGNCSLSADRPLVAAYSPPMRIHAVLYFCFLLVEI